MSLLQSWSFLSSESKELEMSAVWSPLLSFSFVEAGGRLVEIAVRGKEEEMNVQIFWRSSRQPVSSWVRRVRRGVTAVVGALLIVSLTVTGAAMT
jgi:hypothetical protein